MSGPIGGAGEATSPLGPAGLLLAATLVALVAAASPWGAAWVAWWSTDLGGHSVQAWINDALMCLFFVPIGVEIRRELTVGALRTPALAALPVVAALGGMAAPALIYVGITGGVDAGWSVPVATDIAFATAIARLAGARVPVGLLVFLTAFAIADDLGAVVLIAARFGHGVAWPWLAASAAWLAGLVWAGRLGVRSPWAWLAAGAPLWAAVYASGLHATLAGVALGLVIPHGQPGEVSPAASVEHALAPWVAWVVLPLFALANAGVPLPPGGALQAWTLTSSGVALGLVLGKPLGILAACAVAVRLGVARLPERVGWRWMVGASCLGGVGFTMSLFLSALAFPDASAAAESARLGVLGGSAVSAAVGGGWLRWMATREVAEVEGHASDDGVGA
jgi:NhaA family Na+:H+ antiporter